MEVLEPDEFECLSPVDQQRYLRLLARARKRGWFDEGLTFRQRAAWELVEGVGVDELLYGGAAGGGKTEFLCRWLGWRSLRFDRHVGLMLRQTLPQARQTLLRRCIDLFSVLDPPPRWSSLDRVWEFSNGSLLYIGYLQSTEDGYQYQSLELDAVAGDEASMLPPDGLELVRLRLRSKIGKGTKPRMVLASNPGGVGHRALKDRFPIEPVAGDGKFVFEGTEVGYTRVYTIDTHLGARELRVGFVPSFVQDNPHLGEEYVVRLSSAPERLRRMYLHGDWGAFEGQFWSEFDTTVHVKEFDIPAGERVWVGLDFGWASPFAAVFATHSDGVLLVFDELYMRKVPPEQQAEMIRRKTVDYDLRLVVADPAAWAQATGGQSVATRWASQGLPVVQGNNARIAGWQALRERFSNGTILIHPRCEHLIDELVEAQTSQTTPEDMDPKSDDHALDALRYVHSTVFTDYKPTRKPMTPIERDFERLARERRRRRW